MLEEKLIFMFSYITTDFLNKYNSDIKWIFSRLSRHHNTERQLLHLHENVEMRILYKNMVGL